jgi:hypothetical protein
MKLIFSNGEFILDGCCFQDRKPLSPNRKLLTPRWIRLSRTQQQNQFFGINTFSMPHHPKIDKNLCFILEHLSTHSLFWISKAIGVDKATFNRYAKRNGWKGAEQKVVLSIQWSSQMINQIKKLFPNTFNRDLAAQMRISQRTLIRKARELGLTKEEGFLDKNRHKITQLAMQSRPKNDAKTIERITQAGVATRFKKGSKASAGNNITKAWETRRKNQQEIKAGLLNPY